MADSSHPGPGDIVETITIVEGLAAQGADAATIATALNEAGNVPPGAERWSGPLVEQVMRTIDAVRAEQEQEQAEAVDQDEPPEPQQPGTEQVAAEQPEPQAAEHGSPEHGSPEPQQPGTEQVAAEQPEPQAPEDESPEPAKLAGGPPAPEGHEPSAPAGRTRRRLPPMPPAPPPVIRALPDIPEPAPDELPPPERSEPYEPPELPPLQVTRRQPIAVPQEASLDLTTTDLPGDDDRDEPGRRKLVALLGGLLLLAAIAAAVGAVLAGRDGDSTVFEATGDRVAAEGAANDDGSAPGESTSIPGDGIPGDEDRGADGEPSPSSPTTTQPDPADMMAIRIEPEQPVVTDPATGLTIEPASATIRADGLLHIEGAFPTAEAAASYIDGMAAVFGRDSIVEGHTINPAAPSPTRSDVALDKPVLFASGTAEIDPSYIDFLAACGDVLKLNPQITMSIAAFTDSTGPEELNLELSQKRAQAIYDFYRTLDIGETQLEPIGLGEVDPIGDNSTEEGREQNRRAILKLLDVLAER